MSIGFTANTHFGHADVIENLETHLRNLPGLSSKSLFSLKTIFSPYGENHCAGENLFCQAPLKYKNATFQ